MLNLNEIKDYAIFNKDVFELIPELPPKSIDLVLTDPPYGDDEGYGRECKTIENNETYKINERFLLSIHSKIKDNGLVYLCTNHKFMCEIRSYAVNICAFRYINTIVLVKNKIGMGYGIRNHHEIVLVFEKGGNGKATYNDKSFSNYMKMSHVHHDSDSHPHEKTKDFFKKIILHSSNKGDVVFDGFLGTGNNVLSCLDEERIIIGSEIDKKWFDLITRKIQIQTSQTTLNLF